MKGQFPTVKVFDAGYWPAMGEAIREAPQLFRLWNANLVSGFNAINKMVVHWGIADSST